MITPQSIVVASTEQLSGQANGATVIAGLREGNYYALRGVAARVWELVQAPVPVRDLPLRIAVEYEVTPETCAPDVLELLGQLEENGLIEVCDATRS